MSACGIASEEPDATEEQPTEAAGGNGDRTDDGNGTGGGLVIANWPLYIDVEEDESTSSTIQQFEEETGISVEYLEEIDSNAEWLARFRNQLDAGEDIGRDMTVLTD